MELSLTVGEAVQGPDHRDVVADLDNLATILRNRGQAAEARSLMQRAPAFDEALHEPDHPDVARGLNNLALILQAFGQPAAVRLLLERAMAITEAAQTARSGLADDEGAM